MNSAFTWLLALTTLLISAPVEALEGWTAEVGTGGVVVPGTWAPLRVEAPVEVGPWTLEVRASNSSGRVSPPVILRQAAGGVWEHPLFLADGTRALNLRFLVDDLVRQELDLPLASRIFPGHVVGTDGLDAATRGALSGVLFPEEPVRVIPYKPSRWPTSPLSYGALAALVVKDPGPVLSPAQREALRAWIASGGQLFVVSPRAASGLEAQVGEVPGRGKVQTVTEDRPLWKDLLSLRPYGQAPRWGTEFGPSAQGTPTGGSPLTLGALVFVLAWTGLGLLILLVRKKGGLGWPVALALGASAAVLVLSSNGALDWERGLSVHTREITLAGVGRFVSVEAAPTDARPGPLGWTATSPWALARWKEQPREAGTFVRVDGSRVVLEAFLPEEPRQGQYRVRWESGTLKWAENKGGWVDRETAPEGYGPDLAWIRRLAQSSPTTVWSTGREAQTCWLKPEQGGPR